MNPPPLQISEEAKNWASAKYHPEVMPMENRFQLAINKATEKLTARIKELEAHISKIEKAGRV